MGKTIEIETPEQLEKLLGEMKATTDETAKKVDEAVKKLEQEPEGVVALRNQQAEIKTVLGQLEEKYKSLTLAFKAKGSWKEGDEPEGRAYRFGKFINTMLQARYSGQALSDLIEKMGAKPVRDAKAEGWGEMDEKLFTKTSATVSDTPLRGDATTGSYLVPVEYRAELIRLAADASKMMGLVRTLPMRGITAYLPSTTSALTFTVVTNQATAKTEKFVEFGQVTLTAQVFAGWLAITEEMDEDSLVELGTLIRDMFAEAWGTKFDVMCLTDSTYGALYASGINSLVMDSGKTSFSHLEADDLLNLIAELNTEGKRQGGRFFFHTTVFDVVRKLKDANGNYIWQKPEGAQPGTIWGYPYVITDGMPALSASAVSSPFVAFGNPRHIINGNRVGFEFRIFDQTMGTMQYDQIYLRCRLRQAFVLSMPSAWAVLKTAAS